MTPNHGGRRGTKSLIRYEPPEVFHALLSPRILERNGFRQGRLRRRPGFEYGGGLDSKRREGFHHPGNLELARTDRAASDRESHSALFRKHHHVLELKTQGAMAQYPDGDLPSLGKRQWIR